MKQVSALGLACVAVLCAMVSVGAASASAFTCWQDNGVCVTGTENINIGIPTGKSLTVKDSKGLLGNPIMITVSGGSGSCTGGGTVSTGGADTWTSFQCTNGSSSNTLVCPNPATVAFVNLPWATQISGTRDNITNGTNNVGFKITCNNGTTDTCTASSLSQALSNDASNRGVDSTFDSSTPVLNCTAGGTGTGTILGTVIMTLTNGHTLSVA
jgi:hypothetical protein